MANTSTFSRPKKTRMIRKQIYIASEQNAKLKQAAAIQNATEAEVIRDLIDELILLPQRPKQPIDNAAMDRFLNFSKNYCLNQTNPAQPYKWNRDEIYEERFQKLVSRLDAQEA